MIVEFSIMLFVLNISIHLSKRASDSSKIFRYYYVISLDFICITLSLCVGMFLIFLEHVYYTWPIIILTLTYINLCVASRRALSIKVYTITFVFLSLFFLLEITILFGIKRGIKPYYPFDIDWIEMYSAYFFSGLKGYFILPDSFSISSPKFIQFIVGCILDGTVISEIYNIFKSVIFPSNK